MTSKAAVAAAIATLVARRVTAAPLSEADVTVNIMGGHVAPNGAFPYIVSLSSGGEFVCGGSLINPEWVLTASHCLYDLRPNLKIRAGSNDRTTGGIVVDGVDPHIHPGFTMEELDSDVALLRCSPPINASANIGFVKMPQKNSEPKEGEKTVAGWGIVQGGTFTLPEDLRQVSVPLVPHQKCDQILSSEANLHITDNMICAGKVGKDSCPGDSGGPLIDAQTGVLEGVVSHGFACNTRLPGIYARVSTQLDFIQSVMDGKSPTQPQPPSQPPGSNPGNPGDPGDGSLPGGGIDPGDGSVPGGGIDPGDGSFPGGGIDPGDGSFPGGGIDPGDGIFPGNGIEPGDGIFPGGGIDPGDGSFPGGGIDPGDGSFPGGGIDPGDGIFPGNGIEPGDGIFPGDGIDPGDGVFPGGGISPSGGGFPGFEGDDGGLGEIYPGMIGGF